MFSDISLYAMHALDSNKLHSKLKLMVFCFLLIQPYLFGAAFTPWNNKSLTGQVLVLYFEHSLYKVLSQLNFLEHMCSKILPKYKTIWLGEYFWKYYEQHQEYCFCFWSIHKESFCFINQLKKRNRIFLYPVKFLKNKSYNYLVYSKNITQLTNYFTGQALNLV